MSSHGKNTKYHVTRDQVIRIYALSMRLLYNISILKLYCVRLQDLQILEITWHKHFAHKKSGHSMYGYGSSMAIYLSLTGRAILLHNRAKNIVFSHAPYFICIQSLMSWHMNLWIYKFLCYYENFLTPIMIRQPRL